MPKKERKKGHLRGFEWRQSDRALAKKDKAKRKHFGYYNEISFEEGGDKFVINREAVGLDFDFGIVAEIKSGKYTIWYKGEYHECLLDNEAPSVIARAIVVGDHVTLKKRNSQIVVDHFIERKNTLSRLRRDSTRSGLVNARDEHVMAANVDIAIIVTAVKNPPFHPKLIDRYLVLIQHSKIRPLICLNKCDLLYEEVEILEYYEKLGIQVIRASAESGMGIEELRAAIRGQSSVLLGHSGVGKSSLVNRIDETAQLKTGIVAEKSGKGKHTTTWSQLIVWDNRSYIIDTPGIRALGMWNIEKEDIQWYFEDISGLANECRFSNCLHVNISAEMCGVVRAVQEHRLPIQRYDSYLKLIKEL